MNQPKQLTSYKVNNIIEGSYIVLILTSLCFIQFSILRDFYPLNYVLNGLITSRVYTAINYIAGISFFNRIRKLTHKSSIMIRYLGLIVGSVGLVSVITIGNIIAIVTAFTMPWSLYK